jgi:hypothetical protein
MSGYEVAQLSIALMKAPLGSPWMGEPGERFSFTDERPA